MSFLLIQKKKKLSEIISNFENEEEAENRVAILESKKIKNLSTTVKPSVSVEEMKDPEIPKEKIEAFSVKQVEEKKTANKKKNEKREILIRKKIKKNFFKKSRKK